MHDFGLNCTAHYDCDNWPGRCGSCRNGSSGSPGLGSNYAVSSVLPAVVRDQKEVIPVAAVTAFLATAADFGQFAQQALVHAAPRSLHNWAQHDAPRVAMLWESLFIGVESYAAFGFAVTEGITQEQKEYGKLFAKNLLAWHTPHHLELSSVSKAGYNEPAIQWLLYELGASYVSGRTAYARGIPIPSYGDDPTWADLLACLKATVCGEGSVLQVPPRVEDYYNVARKGSAKV